MPNEKQVQAAKYKVTMTLKATSIRGLMEGLTDLHYVIVDINDIPFKSMQKWLSGDEYSLMAGIKHETK